MSEVENVNICYICDLAFETRKQFIKHKLSDEHLNRARKEYENEVEDETCERLYDVEEDDYIFKHKTITKDKFNDDTKDIIKTKTTTNTKAKTNDNIYSRIRYICKEFNKEFRNKIALTTHSYSHNRKYLENTE